jgi:hypothetical protein
MPTASAAPVTPEMAATVTYDIVLGTASPVVLTAGLAVEDDEDAPSSPPPLPLELTPPLPLLPLLLLLISPGPDVPVDDDDIAVHVTPFPT